MEKDKKNATRYARALKRGIECLRLLLDAAREIQKNTK
jgi:hypothetical protein